MTVNLFSVLRLPAFAGVDRSGRGCNPRPARYAVGGSRAKRRFAGRISKRGLGATGTKDSEGRRLWYNWGMSECFKVLQRTIVREGGFAGAALHCGRKICVRLLPASENAGIVFRRTDLGGAEVRAAAECVSETNLATGFKSGKAEVCTVEHLLSALAATGVDNVIVELDGAEIPIADGSANPWLLLLRHCRLRQQQAAKRFVRVLRPVEVCDGERRARFFAADAWRRIDIFRED